jgi:hypothetical protein
MTNTYHLDKVVDWCISEEIPDYIKTIIRLKNLSESAKTSKEINSVKFEFPAWKLLTLRIALRDSIYLLDNVKGHFNPSDVESLSEDIRRVEETISLLKSSLDKLKEKTNDAFE